MPTPTTSPEENIPDQSPFMFPFEDDELITFIINSLRNDLNISLEIPYNTSLLLNPFNNCTYRTIQVKGRPSITEF